MWEYFLKERDRVAGVRDPPGKVNGGSVAGADLQPLGCNRLSPDQAQLQPKTHRRFAHLSLRTSRSSAHVVL